MKLTKSKLKQIIKEETAKILEAYDSPAGGKTEDADEMPLKGLLSKEAEEDWASSPSIMRDKGANYTKDIAAVEAQMTAIWNKTKEFAKIAKRRVGGEWYHFLECDAECDDQRLTYLNEELVNAEAAGNKLLAQNIQMYIDRLERDPMEPEVPETPEL